MNMRERGIPGKERLVVTGISALYTGAQDPAIQRFVQRATEAIADIYLEAGEEIPSDAIKDIMLALVGDDPSRRKEFHIRGLNHAKGVLVGQKKSSEREERLRIVSEKLSELSPTPTK